MVPAPSPSAGVAGKVQSAENPLGGGPAPAPAREDERAKRNGLETQLAAQKPVFARVQEVGTDAHVKSQLKFFGAKTTRQSERDRRERDKNRKRHYKLLLAQHGDSDDLESP